MGVHRESRSAAVALCGVLLVALLPKAAGAAVPAILPVASVASTYSFAQSSLAGGGFENVIAADPRHNGVVISGSDVTGFYRSTDFGKTWLAADSGSISLSYHPVAAIAFDPKARNDVYAATDGGVAESTDDGVSWTPLPALPGVAVPFNGSNDSNPSGTTPSERCVGNLLAFDDKRHVLYAASYDDGVWRYALTGTGTGTWSQVVPQTQLGNAFCLTSLAWGPSGALDVSTWGAGVWTISDPSGSLGTASAVAVPGSPPVVQELAGLADGDVWGAAYDNGVGVIRSGTWETNSNLSGTAGANYMSIAGYVFGGDDVVIAGSDTSPLYAVLEETKDSGSTWTALPSLTAPDNVSTDLLGGTANPWWHGTYKPALLYSQSMVPSSIVIEHEKKGDDIWIAGYGGNWRLLGAEGQTTFYPSDFGIGSTVNHQIAIDPTTIGQPRSSQRIYVGDTDWGLFSSADGFSTQQGISDDAFTCGGTAGTVGFDTVVDGGVVYVGVGNRDTNTQGDVLSAAAPATSCSAFTSTGLAAATAATGGGRPLAVGVVDASGTPTLFVAVEGNGMWTRVGSNPWVQNTSLFMTDPSNTPTGAIAIGGGAVYAYDARVGVYRSLDDGATWALIWSNPSVATTPFLMVDSARPTNLWVSAKGGLFDLVNAASTSFGTVPPVIAGMTSGLAELDGQVFTTELVPGTGLELQVSDPTGTTFTNLGNSELSATQAIASGIAVANDGTVYIATSGSGVIVGTPVDPTTASLGSSLNPSTLHTTVTFTATVTALDAGDTPGGTVVFWNGTKKLGTAALTPSGVATYATKRLKKGTSLIIATYQGDANDDPSTSNTVDQVVT